MILESPLGQTTVAEADARRQVARIIFSDAFGGKRNKTRPTRSVQLLCYIVDRTLKGDMIKGEDILIDVFAAKTFGRHVPANAKVGVNKLRQLLANYEASTGLDELVSISIPHGQYNAAFEYNSKSPAQIEVKKGLFHVHRETPDHIATALSHFNEAIRLRPDFSESYAGKAAALLTSTLHTFTELPSVRIKEAEAAAREARSLNSSSWAAGVQIGATFLFRHEWEAADKEFSEAARKRPVEILLEGGYGPFLLARGRYEDTSKQVEFYLKNHPDDFIYLRRAALYLYVLRRYAESKSVTEEILRMNEHLWLGHLMYVFIFLAKSGFQDALAYMRKASLFAGEEIWPGLYILCLALAGERIEAEERFARLVKASESGYIQAMQLALGYMALDQHQQAIRQLSRACDDFDPFTAWLHLWPFLVPLRSREEFKALLDKWSFPKSL